MRSVNNFRLKRRRRFFECPESISFDSGYTCPLDVPSPNLSRYLTKSSLRSNVGTPDAREPPLDPSSIGARGEPCVRSRRILSTSLDLRSSNFSPYPYHAFLRIFRRISKRSYFDNVDTHVRVKW